MLKFRLFALAAFAAAICSATPVTYSNTAVTCKEFVPNIFTGPLTVTVDSALNGGTITAGSQASDNCYFKINGNSLAATAPFTNGNYNYTSAQDIVCWKTGGFCVSGPQLVTLNIADAAGGKLFTIVSASITTSFVLGAPDGGGSPVPEPQSLALLGSALVGFGLVSRRKKA